jgi:hypothetical protein
LESKFLLVQAASGLERLMAGSPTKGLLKDSLIAQISAAIYYKSHAAIALTESPKIKGAFAKIIFDQVQEDFGLFMDAQARSKPNTYHHVYEWNKGGIREARLFQLNPLQSEGMSVRFSYSFKPSTSLVPSSNSNRRHVFAQKAAIMEEGRPLTISPRYAERLIFEVNAGYTVYMPKGESVTVRNPGGNYVKGAFRSAYQMFFKGNLVNLSIKKSGFQKIFTAAALKTLNLPTDIKRVKYSFSPNAVRSSAYAAANGVVV